MCQRCNSTGRTQKLFAQTFCTTCHGTGSSAFEKGTVTDLHHVIRSYHKENMTLRSNLRLYSEATNTEFPIRPEVSRLKWSAPRLCICKDCNGTGRYFGITGSMECGLCLGTGQTPDQTEALSREDFLSVYIATLASDNRWMNAAIEAIRENTPNLDFLLTKHHLHEVANKAY